MKTSNHHSSGRRTFFRTSGAVIAGLGIPVAGISGTGSKNSKETDTSDSGLPVFKYEVDYVVVGGGIAGTCSAITAARAGLKVVLVQDRPVLGGNASSEIRLWILGATSHMNNNNRWAREGGVHEEILVENMYRNREGNPVFFDALLIDKVWAEPNITLLLNTAVYFAETNRQNHIKKIAAFCSQNSTHYEISAPFFCDASGDGILGFLSGAAFRMGAEKSAVFGEKFIMPDDFGQLLGHSMYFYSKDAGVPVKYVPPAFALKDIPKHIPRFRDIHRDSSGCRLWWLEWGAGLDHVFESELIKNELWRVIYGVWDYIKNSGTFENVDNLTLEWASTVPGKRESRRFEGDYTLIQQDIVNQTHFEDAIAYGGWAIDLHPSNGVYSSYHGCTQYHSKGVYTIPYRSIYSRNIQNLFFAGRLISVSHIAFGSTRVISTGTLCGQAAALAARLCLKNGISPREVYEKNYLEELQRDLLQTGQYIPKVLSSQPADLVNDGALIPSSTHELSGLPGDGTYKRLSVDSAMLLPFSK
ncbi:MAG TPA: FAD-dependent oxidoreductase, partial [Prolixibacteraceae bacterium]|nr:FAD-dependent oxidoreductase [Prolixibacteraceae bacterium]